MNTVKSWSDIHIGESIGTIRFPITVSRMIIVAGSNRNFDAIHHNTEFSRASGAPDMYADTLFLMGMWERLVRDYIGPGGRVLKIGGFRMRSFNCPGDTVVVSGHIARKWIEEEERRLQIEIRSDNKTGLSVGPGFVIVSILH